MATRKPSAKPEASTTRTDTPDTNAPGLDPDLERIRDEARKAEPTVKVTPPDEPGIDPALVEARKKALEAEAKRKS